MTAKPNHPAVDRLLDLLNQAAATLPDLHWRNMFGWPALFSDRGVFALVSDTERILVRLPDPIAFVELLAQPDAEEWQLPMGTKPVKHWVVVPHSFHHNSELLERWVRRAYDLSLTQQTNKRKGSK